MNIINWLKDIELKNFIIENWIKLEVKHTNFIDTFTELQQIFKKYSLITSEISKKNNMLIVTNTWEQILKIINNKIDILLFYNYMNVHDSYKLSDNIYQKIKNSHKYIFNLYENK